MKKGRIDKYSKELLFSANQVFINRYISPDGPFFNLSVNTNGYHQFLTTSQGGLFFDSEKSAIKFIQRHRGQDLRNPENPFKIIILPGYADSPCFS